MHFSSSYVNFHLSKLLDCDIIYMLSTALTYTHTLGRALRGNKKHFSSIFPDSSSSPSFIHVYWTLFLCACKCYVESTTSSVWMAKSENVNRRNEARKFDKFSTISSFDSPPSFPRYKLTSQLTMSHDIESNYKPNFPFNKTFYFLKGCRWLLVDFSISWQAERVFPL